MKRVSIAKLVSLVSFTLLVACESESASVGEQRTHRPTFPQTSSASTSNRTARVTPTSGSPTALAESVTGKRR